MPLTLPLFKFSLLILEFGSSFLVLEFGLLVMELSSYQ